MRFQFEDGREEEEDDAANSHVAIEGEERTNDASARDTTKSSHQARASGPPNQAEANTPIPLCHNHSLRTNNTSKEIQIDYSKLEEDFSYNIQ